MINRIFNTTFETSIRLLLNLYLSNKKYQTLEELIISDFITIRSNEFGLSDSNLHGVNDFAFSEFPRRRELAKEAIKRLVLKKLVEVKASNGGLKYSITDSGVSVCKSFSSDYAKEYKYYSKKTNSFIENKEEIELLEMITTKATVALREE